MLKIKVKNDKCTVKSKGDTASLLTEITAAAITVAHSITQKTDDADFDTVIKIIIEILTEVSKSTDKYIEMSD